MTLFIIAFAIMLVFNIKSDIMGYVSVIFIPLLVMVTLLFTELLTPKICRGVCKELGGSDDV